MYKILTILGTRPEIIKLSELIKKLDKYFYHTLVHTGQNYDFNLNNVFFKDLGIRKPDYFLNVKSKTTEESIAKIILNSSKIIKKIKPDAVLIYGDTNSCLSAISAKKNMIPIFHMEAGNRCFDDRVPEEVNRRIIDHISDINLVLNNHAKNNLLKEGIKQDRIFNTGSHMFEIINNNISKINNSEILKKLKLKKKEYFLVSLHREENVDKKSKLKNILNSINALNTKFKTKKIIFSTHPRTKKNINKFNIKISKKNIYFSKPFNFSDYCNLQKNSFCTISDSGTIFEESSIMKFPAITIRDSHERPEGIDSGSVTIDDCSDNFLIKKVRMSINELDQTSVTDGYSNKNVSSRIIKIISGYISQINRKIYYK